MGRSGSQFTARLSGRLGRGWVLECAPVLARCWIDSLRPGHTTGSLAFQTDLDLEPAGSPLEGLGVKNYR